ncbi:hypothetical protein K1719_009000 [Acacia pycnantha]|nr:hypothetical protein K1719_009000 [Acacia pycnantha]
MAFKIIPLALVLLGMLVFQASSRILQEASMQEKHEQWMIQYGKVYMDIHEKEKRFNVFKQNVEYIEGFNRDGTKPYRTPSFKYENVTDVPSSVDWRQQGAVTPIKNQGECGCCWAFSAVAATEGIIKLSTGKLISLSEQELVDCDTGVDQGCEGGLMDDAFKFIIKNNGINSEADYPYKGVDGSCNANEEGDHVASIKGYEDVPANSEQALQKAVVNQPVSVAIDASGSDFQFYKSGIFTGSCGTELDHGVTVVGYGVSDNTEYWLVKNSWGTEWGEEGYIRMQRNVDAQEGLCGIAMQASYPTA